jgi:hypothetical protein
VPPASCERTNPSPDSFKAAHSRSWSSTCHVLLVTVDGAQVVVRPIGALTPGGALEDIPCFAPPQAEGRVKTPIVITAAGAAAAGV